jgi:hypothetical protein
MDYTLTYRDAVNPERQGWMSFFSFVPDGMVGFNNKMFSFKDGQLYEHHSEAVPRNNFYGVQGKSTIEMLINDAPSENKVLKAISQEGTEPWGMLIRSYESDQAEYRETTLEEALFQEKEGQWFTHLRRAESTGTTEGSGPLYGISVPSSSTVNTLVFSSITRVPNKIVAGDVVYNELDEPLGIVVSAEAVQIPITGPEDVGVKQLVITLDDAVTGNLTDFVAGQFVYGRKDSRVDGSVLRGYTFYVFLENESTSRVELFAVNANIAKSYR